MEQYSKMQLSQFKELNNQIETRLTRTKSVALTNEWRQKQNMRNYQSEYDRIRNELENSALPYQTQDSIKKRKIELEKMGVKIYNIIS
jgi:uncharacterized protein YukE